jgi:hypothetical protein
MLNGYSAFTLESVVTWICVCSVSFLILVWLIRNCRRHSGIIYALVTSALFGFCFSILFAPTLASVYGDWIIAPVSLVLSAYVVSEKWHGRLGFSFTNSNVSTAIVLFFGDCRVECACLGNFQTYRDSARQMIPYGECRNKKAIGLPMAFRVN